MTDHMMVPDALALHRPTYKLTVSPHNPGDVLVSAQVICPGLPAPAKLLSDPETLEQLALGLDPQPLLAQVLSLIEWCATVHEQADMAPQADTIRRVASYLAGNSPSPMPDAQEVRSCVHFEQGQSVSCNNGNARQCSRCQRSWCVKHWYADQHPCTPAPRPKVVP